jgi:hypothetical protein
MSGDLLRRDASLLSRGVALLIERMHAAAHDMCQCEIGIG